MYIKLNSEDMAYIFNEFQSLDFENTQPIFLTGQTDGLSAPILCQVRHSVQLYKYYIQILIVQLVFKFHHHTCVCINRHPVSCCLICVAISRELGVTRDWFETRVTDI